MLPARSRSAAFALGVALDAVVLAGSWLVLKECLPVSYYLAAWWLQVTGLAASAWLIHVLAVPAFLGSSEIRGKTSLRVLRSFVFIASAAVFGPAVIIIAVTSMRLPAEMASWVASRIGLTWSADISMSAFWCALAALIGAVFGLVMSGARRLDRDRRDPALRPSFLVDIVGGAVGGCLTMALLIAASGSGLLTLPDDPSAFGRFIHTPFHPLMIGVGVVALVPHLLLACAREGGVGLPAPARA